MVMDSATITMTAFTESDSLNITNQIPTQWPPIQVHCTKRNKCKEVIRERTLANRESVFGSSGPTFGAQLSIAVISSREPKAKILLCGRSLSFMGPARIVYGCESRLLH